MCVCVCVCVCEGGWGDIKVSQIQTEKFKTHKYFFSYRKLSADMLPAYYTDTLTKINEENTL